MIKGKNIFSSKRAFIRTAVPVIIMVFFLITAISCKTGKEEILENKESAEAEQADEDIEGAAKASATVTAIDIWDSCGAGERIAMLGSIEAFLAMNPSVEINTRHFRSQEELEDQFEAASLAGSGPEMILVNMDGVRRLAPENIVREIKDEIDYIKVLDGLAEISGYNNKKYIIPFRSTDFLMLFYNKGLIENPPSDFEATVEYCREVNNADDQIYGWLLNGSEADWVIPFIGGYSDWIIDYNTNFLTLDSEATEKTLEFLNFIYNEEKIMPYDVKYEEMDRLFRNGNAAMIINGTWSIEEYEAEGLNFGISKIPKVWQGDRNPTPLISGLGFMINVNCYGDELEASKKFIEYMLSEEAQISWTKSTQTFPVLKNIDTNSAIRDNPLVFNAFQQAKICRGKPCNDMIRVIRDAVRINVENVIAGSITPQEAASKIQLDAVRLKSGDITAEELKEEKS